MPILPSPRDPRLITARRGGTLTDEHHHLLAEWAVVCVERVLPLFEREVPQDTRPRDALAVARGWIRGEVTMKEAHRTAFVANAAGKDLADPARFVALAAGQAVAVAHVAAHDLGAAAYAIRAVVAEAAVSETAPSSSALNQVRLAERDWQRAQIPPELRDLVLEDQRLRSPICWNVFDD